MAAITLPGGVVVRPSVKPRSLIFGVVAVVAAILLIKVVLPDTVDTPTGHWTSPTSAILLGAIQGVTYGLLGVGLILIYRSNRIINFAHGNIGAMGAAVFEIFVVSYHIPYWIAIVFALIVAAFIGFVAEAAVIRRLRKAPPVMSIVATLGIGQFLGFFALAINAGAGAGSNFPKPAYLPTFRVGALLVTQAYVAMLVFSPVVVVAVALFLKYSRFGLALRCAAANPEAARMTGISTARMSGLAWSLAAAIAAISAIFTSATGGVTNAASFGPSLLLRALVPAVIAGMNSMPKALVGGTVLGITEGLLQHNFNGGDKVDVVLFVMIVGALLLQRAPVGRAEEKGSWAIVQGARPLPAALRQLWLVRNLGTLVGLAVLLLCAALPLAIDNTTSIDFVYIFALVIIGLSVGIVTGLGGQVSLGQFGIAAIGAVVCYQTVRRTGNYVEGFAYAGIASALTSVLIGIPALRVKGLLLTVTTLSFSLVVPGALLTQGWAFSVNGVQPGRPILFGHALTGQKDYYYLALLMLVGAVFFAANVRRGGVGRLLVAVRDNEDAARAFTVSAVKVKLIGFAVAGFLAGVGGALYAQSQGTVNADSFKTSINLDLVVMTVIGGVGLLSGPMLGALIVLFIPEFAGFGSAGLAATSLGQLIIIMYLPGGIAQIVTPMRDRIAALIGARAGIDVTAAFLSESSSGAAAPVAQPARTLPDAHPSTPHQPASPPALVGTAPVELPPGPAAGVPAQREPLDRARRGQLTTSAHLLEADGIRKSFGGVRAVRGVSFGVKPGETLGLIGPNGAGKTTTFELLAGFTRADEGSVRFDGRDVTYLTPEARAHLGLIRSFQDAALFPTLTVTECVQLSLERVDPTRVAPALLGLSGQERRKAATARDLVGWMGLERYRSAQIQALSTGTRRITEIACLVALEPRLLLLDEPSSGVAQRETEALGGLLEKLREQLSLTMVIIEHDIPLIMGISDRIVAMADGEVIAAGTPDVVRNDPAVVEAYLGGSITAIERSGGAESAGSAAVAAAAGGAGGLADGGAAARRQLVLPGLGPARTAALLAAFGSMEALHSASDAELTAVPGIGPGTARRIRLALAELSVA